MAANQNTEAVLSSANYSSWVANFFTVTMKIYNTEDYMYVSYTISIIVN
jgi:hypothetical protein